MIINGMSSQGKRGDILVPIPTVDIVEFNYDGTTKSLQIKNLDNTKVEIAGGSVTSAVNIGTYTVTFQLKNANKTKWADGATTDKTIEWQIKIPNVYGVSWDGTSTTSWTRTDDAANFSDPVPYVAGATSYGSPFDNIMPWAGMVVSQRTGGTMVAIPKFWYKLDYASGTSGLKIQIANGPMDGYSVSPAHLKRGSETADRDVVYIGRYHCAGFDYKSVTGANPKCYITRSTARTNIHNLGSNIWQCDFAMRFTIWLLYLVEFANWDSQSKIGYGCGKTFTNMGYTDSMPYHTGTTQSSRTIYDIGIQYRNIEGLWDNVRDWIDGCFFYFPYTSGGIYIVMDPNNFNDSENSSYGILIGASANGYPSSFSIKNISGTFPLFISSSGGGSADSYMCDMWQRTSTQVPCFNSGGSYSESQEYLGYGLFCFNATTSSNQSYYIGCRLMELP